MLKILFSLLGLVGLGSQRITLAWMQCVHEQLQCQAEPTPLEVAVIRQFRRYAIPSEIRTMSNPVPVSPLMLIEGLDHFADHRAGCHANDGSGETQIGKNVHPRVPDLRRQEIQSMSDVELFFTSTTASASRPCRPGEKET